MKFSGNIGNGTMNKSLNFGGNPPDPYRDTGKTCVGGGMHCPSASCGKKMWVNACCEIFEKVRSCWQSTWLAAWCSG